tara:strand:- start:1397 stop:2071 length:675 start_codon:yes stop_codon:yes gene_type:complete
MYNNQIIGQGNPNSNMYLPPMKQARASGIVSEYKFITIKPKKQLKELIYVLSPEKKKFIFLKIGKKFNLKDRCIVCGMHHVWEQGDYMRPPIPLDGVVKGRPLAGTYCPKHSSMYMQLEMLQQQVLADKHGLEFKRFVPKMPKMLKSGPITHLSKGDIVALSASGYLIKPPTLGDNRSATNEAIEIVGEINILTDRLNYLMIKDGVRATNTEVSTELNNKKGEQ